MTEAQAVLMVLVGLPGTTVVSTTAAVRDECRALAKGTT